MSEVGDELRSLGALDKLLFVCVFVCNFLITFAFFVFWVFGGA